MIKIEQLKKYNKDDLVLVLVESPNKVKTISQFLPKNFICKATVGHFDKIADCGLYNVGIDTKTFDATFVIDEKKKDIVKELKEFVKRCNKIIIMSDEDREGESIAYSVVRDLGVPKTKYVRCTTTEITERAILEAFNNPRKIDMDLVDASYARAKLDKLVGYRVSPISRRKVGARSVGRCQSPALRLIVDREEEIQSFDSKKYYEIWLPFTKDKKEYKAQYKGLIKDKKNITSLDNKEDANKVIKDCKGKDYVVHSIESKDRSVSAKPPFITSTYQQEVSSKLGYSIDRAMKAAQQLFEGINIKGIHTPLVTYLRTDSTEMDPEFKENLYKFVENKYGKNYLKGLVKGKKSKNVQEGHECFRVIDLEMTPEKLESYINDTQLIKVYTLIYNRTVQSVMTDAIITDTEFKIKNGEHKFIYTEHAVAFSGWREAYGAYDDEELVSGIDLFTKEKLDAKELELLEKETQPPKRYSESSLVKQLEKAGIGRPSTFASIISTLLDPGRGYCEEQGKALAPTEKGITLIHYLKEAFPDIVNYDYTAQMEEQLDLIANGKLSEIDFLKKYYGDLEKQIKGANKIVVEKPEKEFVEDKVCPNCGNKLVYRQGRFGKFIGCLNYPKCKFTDKIN